VISSATASRRAARALPALGMRARCSRPPTDGWSSGTSTSRGRLRAGDLVLRASQLEIETRKLGESQAGPGLFARTYPNEDTRERSHCPQTEPPHTQADPTRCGETPSSGWLHQPRTRLTRQARVSGTYRRQRSALKFVRFLAGKQRYGSAGPAARGSSLPRSSGKSISPGGAASCSRSSTMPT